MTGEYMDSLIEQLKQQIIDALNLEEITPDDIDPSDPLFGAGLGLDSIDALELVVMLERHYGIQIEDIEVGRKALASVNELARFIQENKGECSQDQ
jgi:acyl carrier protein